MKRFPLLLEGRPKPRWPGCGWPGTKCFLIRRRRFENWGCPRRRRERRWRMQWIGFAAMVSLNDYNLRGWQNQTNKWFKSPTAGLILVAIGQGGDGALPWV